MVGSPLGFTLKLLGFEFCTMRMWSQMGVRSCTKQRATLDEGSRSMVQWNRAILGINETIYIYRYPINYIGNEDIYI